MDIDSDVIFSDSEEDGIFLKIIKNKFLIISIQNKKSYPKKKKIYLKI